MTEVPSEYLISLWVGDVQMGESAFFSIYAGSGNRVSAPALVGRRRRSMLIESKIPPST